MDSLWQSPVRRLGMITPITNPRCVQFLKVSQGCAIKPQPQGNHSGVVFYAPVYCDSIKSCYLLTWLHRHQCINFLLIEIVSFFIMIITIFYPSISYCSCRHQMSIVVPQIFLHVIVMFFCWVLLLFFFFFVVINVHYH